MRLKALLLVLLMLTPILVWSQTKISLTFDSAASRLVFTSSGWPAGLPANPELSQAKTIDFPLGTLAPGDNLVIWDRDTNNTAIRPVSKIAGTWAVHELDFNTVGLVKVRVEHEGLAIAAAQVELSDKARKLNQLVDPSSDGNASFFGIAPGDVKVTVKYRTAGKDAEQKQGFTIDLKRQRAEPVLVVSIPDAVETVAAKGATKADDKNAGKDKSAAPTPVKPAPASPVASLLMYVLGLGFAALLIWGMMTYLKKNQSSVAAQLKNLGVEMPEPSDLPPGVAPPAPGPVVPEPPQKIILDDSAPTPLGDPVSPEGNFWIASGAAHIAPPDTPRLVRDSGEIFNLADGENFVGRDTGLVISLPSESTVSRRHAMVTNTVTAISVKDLGSTNGTFVNGAKLDDERILAPGDVVQFGQVKFRFEK